MLFLVFVSLAGQSSPLVYLVNSNSFFQAQLTSPLFHEASFESPMTPSA